MYSLLHWKMLLYIGKTGVCGLFWIQLILVKVAQIEIGALLVGGIVNDHENVMMRKGAEMGHFELIGSTIVLLFKKGHIDLLPEIKECIKGDKEVRVIQGQHIANRTVF